MHLPLDSTVRKDTTTRLIFKILFVYLHLIINNFKILHMKTRLALLFSIVFSVLNISAEVPEKAIPFILDSHVYIQGVIADTIPVSLIYDTGADRLYMGVCQKCRNSRGAIHCARAVEG